MKKYFSANAVYILVYAVAFWLIDLVDTVYRGGSLWREVSCFGLAEAGPLDQYSILHSVSWTYSEPVRWGLLVLVSGGLLAVNCYIHSRRRTFLILSVFGLLLSLVLIALGVFCSPATPYAC